MLDQLTLAACLLMLAACGGAPPTPARPPASTNETGEQTPADILARRVATRAGLDHLGEVAELRFRFVVISGTERRMDALHRWDLRGARDHVTWRDGEHAYDVIVDLRARSATGTLDGAALSGPAAQAAGEEAYGRWVNDSYWLVLPLKLLDPGVRRSLEPQREHAGKRYEILSLQFDRVGLTPGDHYWLFIDPATARIDRWEMLLEGQSAAPRGTSFERHETIGPLTLALDHATDDGQRHVLFEDVEALASVAAEDF